MYLDLPVARLAVQLRFEPRDVWVGVYWSRDLLPVGFTAYTPRGGPAGWRHVWHWRVYVCFLPCLPLVFSWERDA